MDINMDILTFSADGIPTDGKEAVFPIFDKNDDGSPTFLGTGFFIAGNGLFMTAKHVLVGVTSPYIIQFLSKGGYIIRGIAQVDLDHPGDLCVGILFAGTITSTREPLTNKSLSLSFHIPNPVDVVSTYAYPETAVESQGQGGEMETRMDIWAFQYHGVVTEVKPRGAGLAKTGALVCSIDSIPGNSGGPVASPGSNGGILGVNSSGMKGAYHIVSLLDGVRDLKIDNIILPGESNARTVTIDELISSGHIKVV